jgi:acetolactate synthase-1/2/3 large subunit
VVIVADNGMYGTIRMHQEKTYPGRISATGLVNPDFAAYARSFGAFGATVDATDQFDAVLDEALDCGRPAVIALTLDPQAITPSKTLDAFRADGEQRRR